MFTDKDIYNNSKNDKFSTYPELRVPNKNNNFFEPSFTPNNPNTNLFKPKIGLEKPDWTPNFSEKLDVVGDSINLALYTLGMSIGEYNVLDISELKTQRRIDCSCEKIFALNILIHYKKNTNTNGRFPDLNPIKHVNGTTNNYEFNNDYQFENESIKKLYSSKDFSIYDK
jgi:hypothetical protein